MTKRGHGQQNTEEFYKRLRIYFKVSLPFNNYDDQLKYPWTCALRNVLGAIIALLILIWLVCTYLTVEPCFPYTNNLQSKNKSKTPAIVWYATDISWIRYKRNITCYHQSNSFQCDVFRRESKPESVEAYLFYATYLDRFPLPRTSQTIWGLLHDESPLTRLMFMYENALHLFNFSATYSRYSDVPFPLMAMRGLEAVTSTQYFINTESKNVLLSQISPVLFIQSDCNTGVNRDEYVKKLMEYISIDSYGACLQNKNLNLGDKYINVDGNFAFRYHLYGDELLKLIARYKFMITIENGVCNDYITEKLWRAIEVGVVPIYFGSPLVRDWLPNNKSAILLEDYPTPKLLSQHLFYLLRNDTAYEEYLEHKTLGIISNEQLINEITARPYQNNIRAIVKEFECFICEKLHDQKTSFNMVTRKHYDCPLPTSAMTLSVNPNSSWLQAIRFAKNKLDHLYKEIWSSDSTQRPSNTSWNIGELVIDT